MLRRLLVLVAAIVVFATGAAAALGPFAVRILFGRGFILERSDLALLAAGSGAYLVALVVAPALIALGRHGRRASLGWLAGVIGFAIAPCALPRAPIPPVGLAFAAGAFVAAAAMLALLLAELRTDRVSAGFG